MEIILSQTTAAPWYAQIIVVGLAGLAGAGGAILSMLLSNNGQRVRAEAEALEEWRSLRREKIEDAFVALEALRKDSRDATNRLMELLDSRNDEAMSQAQLPRHLSGMTKLKGLCGLYFPEILPIIVKHEAYGRKFREDFILSPFPPKEHQGEKFQELFSVAIETFQKIEEKLLVAASAIPPPSKPNHGGQQA